MTLTLVRHGEVEPRYKGCYNGHLDMGLSEAGREQARRLAAHFRGASFDAVYCSDLRRARQTLEPFDLNVQPHYMDALREKSWGRHEGKTYEAIAAEEGIGYENFEQWLAVLDGEPYEMYLERLRAFFETIVLVQPHDTVLVVTHAGVIRGLLALFGGMSLEEAFGVSLPHGSFVTFDSEARRFGEAACV
jgi:broad specificity phosphatase PhoE